MGTRVPTLLRYVYMIPYLQYYLNSKHELQDGDIIHTARQLNVGPIAHRDPPPLLVHIHVPKLRLGVALYTEPLWGPDGGCH